MIRKINLFENFFMEDDSKVLRIYKNVVLLDFGHFFNREHNDDRTKRFNITEEHINKALNDAVDIINSDIKFYESKSSIVIISKSKQFKIPCRFEKSRKYKGKHTILLFTFLDPTMIAKERDYKLLVETNGYNTVFEDEWDYLFTTHREYGNNFVEIEV